MVLELNIQAKEQWKIIQFKFYKNIAIKVKREEKRKYYIRRHQM
jgi:hypothetical protein